nr:MAG TPA: hypothetical protein [Caudoviricetes sp.]DAY38515.1 MAG TPA: hypothetical protein [Bacteriophage sp.]
MSNACRALLGKLYSYTNKVHFLRVTMLYTFYFI